MPQSKVSGEPTVLLEDPFREILGPRPRVDDLTVVIPTLGREILADSLRSIAAGTMWPAEIILVDQGENNVVSSWVKVLNTLGLNTRHIASSQRGRASAVNRGYERVKTAYVAVTDDDCLVDLHWLENMSRALLLNPNAIVTGRVEAVGGQGVLVVATSEIAATYARPQLKFDPLSGGNMGTSLSVIQAVGFLDEHPTLRTAEDTEWAYRALRAGFSIHYAPDVCVRHYGWRDEAERESQYKSYARSHGGFYGKYLRRGDGFIALRAAIHHLRALRRWIRGSLAGDRESALNGRAYFLGLLPGMLAGLRRRDG